MKQPSRRWRRLLIAVTEMLGLYSKVRCPGCEEDIGHVPLGTKYRLLNHCCGYHAPDPC